MITLFVGDNQEYLAVAAKQHDSNAVLIEHNNWFQVLQQEKTTTTFYTSLGDLPKIDHEISVCWELLQLADVIHYIEPKVWSDATDKFNWSNQKNLLEYYLYLQKKAGKQVLGLNIEPYRYSSYLDLQAQRCSDQPLIWVAGCSVSHGIGVEPDERFGYLTGQHLQIPVCHLTRPGSSVEWAADQILRSDIRSTDTVIWGLTQEVRAPRAINGQIDSWGNQDLFDLDYLMDETRFYKAVTSVHQVINFCGKIGCQLFLLPLISSEKLIMALIHEHCLVALPYQAKFVDYGTDNIHPGPKQHQIWADICVDLICNRTG